MSLTSADLALALGRLLPARRRSVTSDPRPPGPEAPQPVGVRRLGLHAALDAQLRELWLSRRPV
jgi:hypothetical protein